MTLKKNMSSEAGVSGTLVEQIIGAIREAIRAGEFKAGQRLVVADLSEQYGVSFGPIREAIRRLAGEGYLDFTPHKGATVRGFGEKELRELFQVREAIESFVARLAAENIAHGDYAQRLTACHRALHDHMLDGDAQKSSDVRQQFHDLLYEFAGNPYLKEAGQRYTYPLHRVHFIALAGQVRAEDSLREHDDIIRAILAGDGVRAERMMRIHLRNRAAAFCELLDELNQSESDVA
jgi:DNA-binding GntR family transcriptional regulator